jgi:hypothetical protein
MENSMLEGMATKFVDFSESVFKERKRFRGMGGGGA